MSGVSTGTVGKATLCLSTNNDQLLLCQVCQAEQVCRGILGLARVKEESFRACSCKHLSIWAEGGLENCCASSIAPLQRPPTPLAHFPCLTNLSMYCLWFGYAGLPHVTRVLASHSSPTLPAIQPHFSSNPSAMGTNFPRADTQGQVSQVLEGSSLPHSVLLPLVCGLQGEGRALDPY